MHSSSFPISSLVSQKSCFSSSDRAAQGKATKSNALDNLFTFIDCCETIVKAHCRQSESRIRDIEEKAKKQKQELMEKLKTTRAQNKILSNKVQKKRRKRRKHYFY
jgi:hypothetical protein